jgi:hypothetical protein
MKSISLILNLKVYEIAIEDTRAIEDFLGQKKFLMGDRPCNEDASKNFV